MSGGAPVIDYRIAWDQGTGEEAILIDKVLTQSYTVTGLVSSVTYKFKVQSRNSFGFSDFSDEVTILSA